MYRVIGVDEAGKGPVLGSMFIGFSIINLAEGLSALNSYQEKLKEIGVKDSKKVVHKKRVEIFEKLKSMMDFKYVQLIPAFIDKNFVEGGTLYDLELASIAKILNDQKPDLVIIDAFSSSPSNFERDLRKLFEKGFEPKIISENKADSKYEIVGAASIVAKVLRERELEEIRQNIKLDCGSGYPSDPKTRKFMEVHWSNKSFDFIFRKSWDTYRQFSGERIVRVEKEVTKDKVVSETPSKQKTLKDF